MDELFIKNFNENLQNDLKCIGIIKLLVAPFKQKQRKMAAFEKLLGIGLNYCVEEVDKEEEVATDHTDQEKSDACGRILKVYFQILLYVNNTRLHQILKFST
jgi:hypothetical protein